MLVLLVVLILRVYLTRKQSYVARNDDPYWQVLPFIAVTLVFLALPSITVVLLGRRAEVVLPKIRDWMNQNSWVVSEIVLLFFLGITIKSLA